MGKGKSLLVAGIILGWVLLGVLFVTVGYEETWKLWNVPVEKPFFLDFRQIPGSAESFRNGFEPTVKNPYDPAGRLFNYPVFWRLFFYTGIRMEDTLWIVILMLALYFGGIVQPHRLNEVSEKNLAAFRMGASIYLGTFLLGNNWDYRLAFLVFVIPQLSQWLGGKHSRHNLIILWVLAAIYLSSWYFSIKLDLPLLPIDDPAGRSLVMDEFINWTLLPGLAYLFGASSPDWLRQDFQKLLKLVGLRPIETKAYV